VTILTDPVERTLADSLVERTTQEASFKQKVWNTLRDTQSLLSCKSGCSHCCHHPFFISILEGTKIYQHLVDRGLWSPSLKTKLQDARDNTVGLDFKMWLLSNLPCPLLTDGKTCLAYESRPFNCRITLAISPPELCHNHSLGEDTQILSRVEALREYHGAETKLLKRHGAKLVLMPLAEAVLLGAEVSTGKLQIEDVQMVHYQDVSEATHG